MNLLHGRRAELPDQPQDFRFRRAHRPQFPFAHNQLLLQMSEAIILHL
jgi:hypothetical protein